MKTITKIMGKEHKRIEELLHEFENKVNQDKESAIKIFNIFYWNLEKHFFIEEKVIFSIFNSSNSENDTNDLANLLKDHKDILFLIEKIEDNINNNVKEELEDLKKILSAHAKFEDEEFYPRLDEELDELQKQLIFERADEIIRE